MGHEQFAKAINKAVFPGLQGGPHMHTIAAKAVSFLEASQPEFKKYAAQIVDNARALAAALVEKGFKIISGGTDSHVMLVDLRPAQVSGKDAEKALDQVGITVNKNTIPFDPQPPAICSGIRLGTPALTTRGMGVEDMRQIAAFITEAVQNWQNPQKLSAVRDGVRALSSKFPMYRHRLVKE